MFAIIVHLAKHSGPTGVVPTTEDSKPFARTRPQANEQRPVRTGEHLQSSFNRLATRFDR